MVDGTLSWCARISVHFTTEKMRLSKVKLPVCGHRAFEGAEVEFQLVPLKP